MLVVIVLYKRNSLSLHALFSFCETQKKAIVNPSILLITPPFTQLNTPYPATAYLKGYLNTLHIPSKQADLGIEVILSLFSSSGLTDLFKEAATKKTPFSENSQRIFDLQNDYIHTIDLVIDFLQGNNPTLTQLICEGNFFPEASRFNQTEDLEWAFGTMGIHDKAKHLATLYLEDISDFIIETIDPHFGFSRYAERLGRSANSFDELNEALNQPETLIDKILIRILKEKTEALRPDIVGISVPFPGNLFCALKCGQWIRKNCPEIKVILGGGFANTELRSLSDSRVFDYVDFITLDDGEAPMIHLLQYFKGERNPDKLKRTYCRINGTVTFLNGSEEKDIAARDTGTPDYSDLPLNKYISVIEVTNPMHRLWSDGRWNKLTLAHGCYWGRCTFCDTSLDYIKRFEPNTIHLLCNRIEEITRQTKQSGFHFVDEAAPPALLKSLSLEIIRRNIKIVWWANIRFEKNFSSDLCKLMKEAGCIAVSGGLEVASDKILRMINKGVTVSQVAQVCDNFTQAGIMVHAYLMYGFPTQSAQDTIDSLEVVRQLFMNGLVQSGFWHQFALTAHSPVGLNPEPYKITIDKSRPVTFANNDLEYDDPIGCKHELFGEGLSKSLFNYMHGIGFDFPLDEWFDFHVPATTLPPNYIQRIISKSGETSVSPGAMVIWLGLFPKVEIVTKTKKGKKVEMAELTIRTKKMDVIVQVSPPLGQWLLEMLSKASVYQREIITFLQLEQEYVEKFRADFSIFRKSKSMQSLQESGLLLL